MSLPSINNYVYSPGFSQGQYYNAVLCISGNIQSLYLNGNLIATQTAESNILTSYSTINQIMIGCAGDRSNGFTGYLDDFRIYKYGLNSSQVSNLYTNRNVIVHYPFDSKINGSTPNYATLTYDGIFVNNSNITIAKENVYNGSGALSLTNTSGSTIKNYVTTSSKFSTSSINGLSVSLWFKSTGVSGSKMRLFDLCKLLGTQGISVDISGTTGIVASYNPL
jgi:hypothetical protein